jgi:thiol-disulfide isomerase/thioredoxin
MSFQAALSRPAAAVAALACAIALGACGGGADGGAGNPESKAVDYDKALADAPGPLANLYAQGDAILDGGLDAYNAQLADLEGYPVVANAWASWCGPCRLEFPDFQSVSAQRGNEIGFLGVNVDDAEVKANDFLAQLPLPYPSIADPDGEIKNELGLRGLPGTAFYSPEGELVYLKQGPYTSEEQLNADIDRYLG